jgi:hypothetical protein
VSGRGATFWRAVHRGFTLDLDEVALLIEVCRTITSLDDCAEIIARDGTLSVGASGQPVQHPAVAVADRQRMVLARLVAALGLPHVDGSKVKSGAELRSVVANVARWSNRPGGSAVSDAARDAASTRWARERGTLA